MYKENDSNLLHSYIREASDKLHAHELEESYELIMKALNENPDAPQPHNLLGIWYEFRGNGNLARKHYRAAYALDPTYKPANRNLERLCTLHEFCRFSVDFGKEAHII